MLSHKVSLMYDTYVSHNYRVDGVIVKAKLFAVFSVLLLVAVLLWLVDEQSEQEVVVEEGQTHHALTVSALAVTPAQLTSSVSAFGIAKARWALDIISPVAGKVVKLSADMEPGKVLEQGELLAGVADKPYRYELAMAKSRVAQAEVELARYQHEQYVATQVNGKQKLNAFGRFEPHIKFAQAELAAAQAQVNFAQQRLQDSQIAAPYNLIVLEKFIRPSQWLNEGDVVYKVAATDFIDIHVELAEATWQQLSLEDETVDIDVIANGEQVWPASIRYISPLLNEQTRQRSLVLQVANPYQATSSLMPEQHVTVQLKGKTQPFVVAAPATVLTPDNKVWSVVDGKLKLEAIEMIEEQVEQVKFRYLESPATARVLVRFPLSVMLEGQKVNAEISQDRG